MGNVFLAVGLVLMSLRVYASEQMTYDWLNLYDQKVQGEPSVQLATAEPSFEAADPTLNAEEDHEKLGRYRVRIGVTKPEFPKLKYYDVFYHDKPYYPTIQGDYLPWQWSRFQFGFGFHGGYFSDEGNALRSRSDVSEANRDVNQDLVLTLIPIQLLGVASIDLIRHRLAMHLWTGYEYLMVQEARATEESSSSEGSSDGETFVNKGVNEQWVLGASLDLGITTKSSRQSFAYQSMGMQGVSISPYLEVAQALSKKMGDFSRSSFGFLFSFEFR